MAQGPDRKHSIAELGHPVGGWAGRALSWAAPYPPTTVPTIRFDQEGQQVGCIEGANLRKADLTDARLGGADLTGANLHSADLTGAYLTGTDLTGATLHGANLSGADLVGARLDGLYRSIGGTPLTLPTGWVLVNQVLRPG